MGVVYRYTDLSCGIIKYVGIVWSDGDNLMRRVKQHRYDRKFNGISWKIEYLDINICSRTDAEYFESHYISLYGTDKYLNVSKSGWGVSAFLPDRETEWKEFSQEGTAIYSAKDIFEELMSCADHDDRRSIYMKYTKLVARSCGDGVWSDIKCELNRLLNNLLFQESSDIAYFNGWGEIIINFPIIGAIEYRDYDNVFIVDKRKNQIKREDFLGYIELETNKIVGMMCVCKNIFQNIHS